MAHVRVEHRQHWSNYDQRHWEIYLWTSGALLPNGHCHNLCADTRDGQQNQERRCAHNTGHGKQTNSEKTSQGLKKTLPIYSSRQEFPVVIFGVHHPLVPGAPGRSSSMDRCGPGAPGEEDKAWDAATSASAPAAKPEASLDAAAYAAPASPAASPAPAPGIPPAAFVLTLVAAPAAWRRSSAHPLVERMVCPTASRPARSVAVASCDSPLAALCKWGTTWVFAA
mmetsp:Transcript_86952/g.246508  ORF Transcript_86952/g.246508 Transcript_86952/m.246508 type:complete len:225 (+) Transcript_86952:3-677(+)